MKPSVSYLFFYGCIPKGVFFMDVSKLKALAEKNGCSSKIDVDAEIMHICFISSAISCNQCATGGAAAT